MNVNRSTSGLQAEGHVEFFYFVARYWAWFSLGSYFAKVSPWPCPGLRIAHHEILSIS